MKNLMITVKIKEVEWTNLNTLKLNQQKQILLIWMIWMRQPQPTLKNLDLKLLNLKANFYQCNRLLNLKFFSKKVISIRMVKSVVLSCMPCLKKCITALMKKL